MQPRTKKPSILISWALILLLEDSKRALAAAEANLWEPEDCASMGLPSIRISRTPILLLLEDGNGRAQTMEGRLGHAAEGVSLFIEVAR